MFDLMTSFADGTLVKAAAIGADMIPIVVVVGGIAVGERVIGVLLRAFGR